MNESHESYAKSILNLTEIINDLTKKIDTRESRIDQYRYSETHLKEINEKLQNENTKIMKQLEDKNEQ